ncbi:hypothetical protein ACLOJK_022063 [Asimina triloba]
MEEMGGLRKPCSSPATHFCVWKWIHRQVDGVQQHGQAGQGPSSGHPVPLRPVGLLRLPIDGYQGTLWAHCHRQFYRDCSISGTVDFIFGDAAAVFQNCMLVVWLPRAGQQNVVTAQGRTDQHQTSGIVIQNCRIVPEKQLFPHRTTVLSYLGRPWKEFSGTVIMETEIGDLIQPEGWLSWKGNVPNTIFYAEYANRGPGAATGKRVQWQGFKVITDKAEVLPYTVDKFMRGNDWLRDTGVTYVSGFNHWKYKRWKKADGKMQLNNERYNRMRIREKQNETE